LFTENTRYRRRNEKESTKIATRQTEMKFSCEKRDRPINASTKKNINYKKQFFFSRDFFSQKDRLEKEAAEGKKKHLL
jgi:hypothetical protein